jgi:signal transduction histidine kinase
MPGEKRAIVPSLSRASSRRYAAGVVAVALAGVAALVGYVTWSGAAISDAIAASVEDRARLAADAFRDRMTRALAGRDPASPQVWAELDVTLEEELQGLPDLVGITVRLPDGAPAAVIGPASVGRLPFEPPGGPPDGLAIRTGHVLEDDPRATASFLVPRGAPAASAATANVHLRFQPFAELRSRIFRNFQIGASLVVILIYLLAALAYVIGWRGSRAENREREKAVRLRAIGDVAGAIAHELRNPLNAISLSIQVIGGAVRRSGDLEAGRVHDLERARGEVAKISKVVDNFVSFARLSDMSVTEFELAGVVREAFDALAPLCAKASVTPEFIVTGPTTMRGDRDKLGQVAATTLQTVLDAVEDRPGGIEVQVIGTRREVELRIRGFGARVDARRISSFAAARRSWDEPVGLALTIARTWIDLHGGRVAECAPAPGRAEVVIAFPKGFA